MTVTMKKMRCFVSNALFTLCLCVFGTGCGRQERAPESAEADQGTYYHIRETTYPDPDETLYGELEKGGWIREMDLRFFGDKIYRLAQIWGMADDIEQVTGYYIQVLAPPYSQWTVHRVPEEFILQLEDGVAVNRTPTEVISVGDETIDYLCGEIILSESGKESSLLLVRSPLDGKPDSGTQPEIICSLPPDRDGDLTVYPGTDGKFYCYHGGLPGNSLMILDENSEAVGEKTLNGEIHGIVENPADGELYWYGNSSEGVGIWRLKDRTPVLEGFREFSSGEVIPFRLTVAGDGTFYMADTVSLWCVRTGGKPEKIIQFSDMDYILTGMEDISVCAGGELLMKVDLAGDQCLLTVTQDHEAPPERQEIVLASSMEDSEMKECIVRFNRQSDKWKVVYQTNDGGEDWQAFEERIRMEVSAGKGPDLITQDLLEAEGMARNGYLQSLEGLPGDEEAFWPVMLDCGKVDGVLYGIPYQSQMLYAVYSRKLAGERDSWTLREMMDAVCSSNAEILSYGTTGADIVFYYGLTDNDNKELIDWEKGESHLTGELFLELLEFAAQYGDKGKLEAGEVGKAIEEGRVASEMVYMSQLEGINSMEACFGGEPSFIGFPRTEGSGIYAIPRMLYLNSGSEVKEGAEEFLKFLVSEENQMRYAERAAGYEQCFTVRQKSLDRQIELKKKRRGAGG